MISNMAAKTWKKNMAANTMLKFGASCISDTTGHNLMIFWYALPAVKYFSRFNFIYFLISCTVSHIGGVMVGMLALLAVDPEFESRSGQTKDYKNWNLLLLS